jgi:hypothetical protein
MRMRTRMPTQAMNEELEDCAPEDIYEIIIPCMTALMDPAGFCDSGALAPRHLCAPRALRGCFCKISLGVVCWAAAAAAHHIQTVMTVTVNTLNECI